VNANLVGVQEPAQTDLLWCADARG
jgi:hypothetical protein